MFAVVLTLPIVLCAGLGTSRQIPSAILNFLNFARHKSATRASHEPPFNGGSETMRMTGWAAAIAMALGALPAAAAPAPRQPKLIVAISVDQFALTLYQRYRPTYTGGLARLSQGLSFTGYQSHAATETCPGHSTILTGDHPATTGIVANVWYDRATGKSVYCVSVPGADADARGPQNMHVDTLGSWLKAAQPGARVYAISGKDRAAITMGGKHADGVWWWLDGTGFSTSSYAGPATPAVTGPADTFNQATMAAWKASAPALWPEAPAACRALEKPYTFGPVARSGKVPPEQSLGLEPGGKDFLNELHSSPLFDTLVLDFARATIDREHLGHGPATDLLALSFSATDYVGHRFGNGGAEMCTQVAALDATLGALFAKLDSLHVPYVVVLTADHGGHDAAERLRGTGVDAERVDSGHLLEELTAAMRARFGLPDLAMKGEDAQQIFITGVADPAARAQIRAAAIAWLKARPEVFAVHTPEEIAATPMPVGKPVETLTLLQRYRESYDPLRSGDIAVEFRNHTSLYMPKAPADMIAGHGTPWDEDRRVPILFWWPGVKPARPGVAETVDIAPTLAAVAEIKAPKVDGKCLVSVARKCPR
ncbi:putative AlkP superfamily pyrophosphatase or phosphodiesterase [Sphingomonas vulcanisoli]|uniref:AlkP superfamily pyrophosphatase or phosphodiesterase n=1 Tax=Sphingomonas vulcanisoli TaxID=1658060 RepID=A0ABX0TU02_9SPHN|nr:alkaline phosphatase family protein [Sphingomonas vulcanisoli]NIJ07785.1 putative AlkP superfamily pyrophosphatase or phosphodiesterase [Sphingomonas vulcanisoli]